MSTPFAEVPGLMEAILLGVLVLLLFGGSRLPKLMRGLDEGAREFKRGLDQIDDEIRSRRPAETPPVRVDAGYVVLAALVTVGLVVLLALLA